ncbi:MAG TPA: RDD family protein [Candidatus Sulfotelmatobacter sp.]
MNCPKCSDVCSCLAQPSPNQSIAEAADAAVAVETAALNRTADAEANAEAWRHELAQRLNRYRERRKAPPPRYPSLKLPFDNIQYSTRPAAIEASSLPPFEPSSNNALALDSTQSAPPKPSQLEITTEPAVAAPSPLKLPPTSAKIIEFPRFAWAPPSPPPDQLAEPVGEQLRILEVPEFQPPAPALGGIMIEPVPVEPPQKRLGIDAPLHITPWRRRVAAALVDGAIIASACALFGCIFWKIAAVRPPEIQLLSLAAGTLAVFWAVYEYLLIVYSGSTPGLNAAGLELTRFDGSSTTRSLRRWRILASYLSALSLALGYAWAFLDEDSLCWHDRITHTHFGLKKTPATA